MSATSSDLANQRPQRRTPRQRQVAVLALLLTLGAAAFSLSDLSKAQDDGTPCPSGDSAAAMGAVLRYFLSEGQLLYKSGDLHGAASAWEQDLVEVRKQGLKSKEGKLLEALGNVYERLGDRSKAYAYNEQALAIAREVADRAGEGRYLSNLGTIRQSRGDYPKALVHHEQSLAIRREIRDASGQMRSLNNLCAVYRNLGDFPSALAHGAQSLELARETGDRAAEAAVLNNLGSVYVDIRDYSKALALSEQCLAINREIGDRAGEGGALTRLGSIYQQTGDFSKAIAQHEQALAIVRAVGDRAGEAATLNNLGSAFDSLGDKRQALAHFDQALAIIRAIGNRAWEGQCLNNLGTAYQGLGDYPKALTHYAQSLAIRRETGIDPTGTEANIGDVYLEQGRFDEARTIFERLGASLRLGRYYLRAGAPAKARAHFVRSLKENQGTGNTDLLLADHIGLGLAYEALKQYAKARAQYLEAVEMIERQSAALTAPHRQPFFAGKVGGFPRLESYEGLVRVSVKLRDPAAAFHWAERTKAWGLPADPAPAEDPIAQPIIALKDQHGVVKWQYKLRLLEIEQELPLLSEAHLAPRGHRGQAHPTDAAVHHPPSIAIADLELPPGEALIAYEVTEPATYAWLIQDGRITKTLTIPLTRKALTEEVERYRGAVQPPDATAERKGRARQLGGRLYRLLFEGFAPLLTKTQRVTLIPDEVLHLLPFEALVIGAPTKTPSAATGRGAAPKRGRYLGDRYHLTYAQSAIALTQARR